MIIVGAQWYILYNVISGAQTIPTELLEASVIFKLKWWNRVFKIIFPAILPYYITGLMTAAGGAWNASIVAEVITWGDTTLVAKGIGSYITMNTIAGDLPHVALGVIVLVIFVVVIDRVIWSPLYRFVSSRFHLD